MKNRLKLLAMIIILVNPLTLISCTDKEVKSDQLEELSIEISQLKEKIQGYIDKLTERESEIKILQEEKVKLKKIIAKNEKNIANLKDQIEKIKQVNVKIQERLKQFQQFIDEKALRIHELERLLIDCNKEEIEKLRKELNDKNDLIESLKKILESNTTEVEKLQREIIQLTTQHQVAVGQFEQQIHNLNQEKIRDQGIIKALEDKIAQLEKQIIKGRDNDPNKVGIYLCEEMNKNAVTIYTIFSKARRDIISEEMKQFFKSNLFIIDLNLIYYNKRDNVPETHPSLALNKILIKSNTVEFSYKIKMNYLERNNLVTLQVSWTVNEQTYWTEFQKKEGRCSLPSF